MHLTLSWKDYVKRNENFKSNDYISLMVKQTITSSLIEHPTFDLKVTKIILLIKVWKKSILKILI